jgi:hypothetical protein
MGLIKSRDAPKPLACPEIKNFHRFVLLCCEE